MSEEQLITPPNGLAEIIRVYGDPKFSGEADASVDPRWEQASCELLRDLPGVPKLYIHRLIAAPLRAALADCMALGWSPTTIGCFMPRRKRGRGAVSLHTWAIAVDINADTNPLIDDCPPSDPRRAAWLERTDRIPDDVVAAFKARGWFWGGDFQGRFDPQHFQFATGY